MRLFFLGLLVGCLVTGVVVSCAGPIGGNDGGGNDGKNGDTGIFVGALSVKEVTVDCSSPEELYSGLKGAVIDGVDLASVVGVLSIGDAPNSNGNFELYQSSGIVKRRSDGKAMAICGAQDKSLILRILVK